MRVVLIEIVVAYNSEIAILKVGTLCINLINIRVSLAASFMLHFRSTMKASLVLMIILARL